MLVDFDAHQIGLTSEFRIPVVSLQTIHKDAIEGEGSNVIFSIGTSLPPIICLCSIVAFLSNLGIFGLLDSAIVDQNTWLTTIEAFASFFAIFQSSSFSVFPDRGPVSADPCPAHVVGTVRLFDLEELYTGLSKSL